MTDAPSPFDIGSRLGTIEAEIRSVKALLTNISEYQRSRVDDQETRIRRLERFMIGAYASGGILWTGTMLFMQVILR